MVPATAASSSISFFSARPASVEGTSITAAPQQDV
jgi:hypothetical protein